MHCKLCTRHFPPSKNNNGINCTRCCNKEAAEGNDLFASRNLPASAKATELPKKAGARQQQPAQQSTLSDAAATRAIIIYQCAGYPRLGGM